MYARGIQKATTNLGGGSIFFCWTKFPFRTLEADPNDSIIPTKAMVSTRRGFWISFVRNILVGDLLTGNI